MISENKTLIGQDYSFSNNAMPGTDNFKCLKAYATFLLENKPDEFAAAQLSLLQQIDLPLLKHFEYLSHEQLLSINAPIVRELLKGYASGKPVTLVQKLIKKWPDDDASLIIVKNIIVEDIALIASTLRRTLQQFSSAFTSEYQDLLKLITEIDLFTTQAEAIYLKAYPDLKNKKPKDIQFKESQQLTDELTILGEKLKAQELRYQRMISEVEDYAILLMDKEGFIQNWNKVQRK